jgi:filamentous hemagglutinin family protein
MARWRALLLTTTALLAAGPAAAGPDGGTVVGGSATISGQGSATVTINQTSDRAIINWQQFNIGAGELTQFNQPSSSSVALNRVTGGLGPSEILGTLRANGRVFVVNRDGIYFGPNAVIDTAGFLATTSDIRNADFMAGRYNFNIPGRPDASIVNHGTITAHNAGFAALVAPGVRNTGTITATLGTVGLAAGNAFTLDFYGDKLITLAVGDQIAAQVRDVHTGRPLSSLVENAGRLSANGGRVELTAAAARRVVDSVINNRGVIEANSVGTRGGRIILSAATGSSKPAGAPKQTIRLGGTLSASGKKSGQKGGRVVVQAENIEVAGARIDVSGAAGGGTVLIGGDWGGGNPDRSLVSNPSARLEAQKIANAATVTVDQATTIDASATETGNGGKVILWADDRMAFAGTITATGGPQGGDGGFAEVSGKQNLSYLGTVDLRAPQGSNGTLLLDPFNVTISNTATFNGSLGGGSFTPTGNNSILNVGQLQTALGMASVVVTTGGPGSPGSQDGDIFVNDNISWSGNSTLTLSAFRNIALADGVTIANTGAGNLVMRADNGGSATNIGRIIFNQATNGVRVDWTNSTGTVRFYDNPLVSYTAPTDFTPAGQGGGTRGVTTNNAVPNQFTAYMLVNTVGNLDDIGQSGFTLAQTYALGHSIDNANAPFRPIGTGQFTGTFDGLGHTISNPNIAPSFPSTTNSIGLFEWIGSGGIVRNLNLANANVSANPNAAPPGQFVGTLAGQNSGTIQNVTVTTSSVDGTPGGSGVIAGGLVGQNNSGGTIANGHASVVVTVGDGTSGPGGGWNYAGGLVDFNYGTINGSSAGTGLTLVFGGNNSFVGGLVGQNNGAISNSNANVIAFGESGTGNSTAVGGFVGANTGTISNSFASGPVAGDGTASTVILGGFVGLNGLTGFGPPTGTITNSQATSSVFAVGEGQVGGFAGGNSATIQSSQAFGPVFTQGGTAGGFVGMNFDPGSISDSSAMGGVVVGTPGNFDVTAGGFAGENEGVITNSKASGAVYGIAEIQTLGGFVGANNGLIESSSASGNVIGNGSAITIAGGFAGGNALGEIFDSNASGSVSATGPLAVAGGFIGLNIGLIDPSFATGNVDVSGAQFGFGGGFAGWNLDSIRQSFATGAVIGGDNSFIGGFAGLNLGNIFQAYATGPTTGGANSTVGGLLALNFGSIDQTYATDW